MGVSETVLPGRPSVGSSAAGGRGSQEQRSRRNTVIKRGKIFIAVFSFRIL